MVSTTGAVRPGTQGRPVRHAGFPKHRRPGRHLSCPFLNSPPPTARVDGPHAYIPAVDLGGYGMRVRSHRASARQAHGLAVAAHAPHGSGLPAAAGDRSLRVFRRGWFQVQRLRHRGYAWARVWRQPLPGPDPPRARQRVDPPTG